jgi:hypothetical protein
MPILFATITSSQSSHAFTAIRTKHFIITPHLFNMLTELSGVMKLPSRQISRSRTIAHIIVLSRVCINTHFKAFATVETRRRIRIVLIADLVPSTAIYATETLVAIDAVFIVYV